MKPLDSYQQAAIDHEGPETVLIAGPGSGKTATLVRRILEDIKRGTAPGDCVCITYTNAAAGEIRARVALEAPGTVLGYVGTLHSFCLRLMHRYGARFGIHSRPAVLDEKAAEEELRDTELILQTGLSWKATQQAIKDGPVDLGAGPIPAADKPRMLNARYYRNLWVNGAMDYAAILHFGLEVATRLSELEDPPRFALYVDEAQDSAPIDMRIYDALPTVRRFFVGDPDQAIYGFRGGDVSGLLKRASASAATLTLQRNYRSCADVCEAANDLISWNRVRFPKRTEPAGEKEGAVDLWENLPTPEAEAMAIVEDMRLSDEEDSVAVLCRTNSLCDFYADQLQAQGVNVRRRKPTEWPDGWPLARRWVAFYGAPENDIAARHLIVARWGLPTANEVRTQAAAAGKSLNDYFLHSGEVTIDTVSAALTGNGTPYRVVRIVDILIQELRESMESPTLADLSMSMAGKHVESTGGGVDVMTIHGAKGLEWDWVYCPAWEDGILPARVSDNVEEERRLAFVAVTRARTKLVISWAQTRKLNEYVRGPAPQKPSPFYLELLSGATGTQL